MSSTATRHLPVRPNLDQLRRQAKELLRSVHHAEPNALEEFRLFHRPNFDTESAKLADAQHVLAKSYGAASWPRLVLACRMVEAIWKADAKTVRAMVLKNPQLLSEDARGVKSNWGPPMSYAANLGRTDLVNMLAELGADDVEYAFDRACLQGKLETAERLIELGARPTLGCVMGPCETLNADGLAFLLRMGARLCDEHGDEKAPIALILETYSRYPEGKHRCLQLVSEQGTFLPDTPTMAVHRGRIDLLEAHLMHDPHLLTRTFTHREIYPTQLGCHEDQSLALHGTPLAGGTLLHICVDYDELEVAQWLLSKGMPVDAPAAVDSEGFGGHTALFGTVVSQPHRCGRPGTRMFELLLSHGASPNTRASIRKRLRFVEDETEHTYHDVTPLQWGKQFHDQDWVDRAVIGRLETIVVD